MVFFAKNIKFNKYDGCYYIKNFLTFLYGKTFYSSLVAG